MNDDIKQALLDEYGPQALPRFLVKVGDNCEVVELLLNHLLLGPAFKSMVIDFADGSFSFTLTQSIRRKIEPLFMAYLKKKIAGEEQVAHILYSNIQNGPKIPEQGVVVVDIKRNPVGNRIFIQTLPRVVGQEIPSKTEVMEEAPLTVIERDEDGKVIEQEPVKEQI